MTGSFISPNKYKQKYPTNPLKMKLLIWKQESPVPFKVPLISMGFSSDYSCIWYAVYHNRKISINFREMVSEETAVYSIDQV